MVKLIDVDKIENISTSKVDIKDKSLLSDIYDLSQEMIEFTENIGLGLSACQIGIFKQIFIMKYNDNNFKLMINPQKPKPLNNGKTAIYQEGCLSLPNELYHTRRFTGIWVEFYTINSSNLGSPINFVKENLVLKNLEACIYQQEFQHLQGITLRMIGIKLIK